MDTAKTLTAGRKAQEAARKRHGLQCPECHGVRIENRRDQFNGFAGYQCTECGCQWGAPR